MADAARTCGASKDECASTRAVGHVPEQGEILMTVRLYGLWALSIVLVLIVELLTLGRFTLLPVPW